MRCKLISPSANVLIERNPINRLSINRSFKVLSCTCSLFGLLMNPPLLNVRVFKEPDQTTLAPLPLLQGAHKI